MISLASSQKELSLLVIHHQEVAKPSLSLFQDDFFFIKKRVLYIYFTLRKWLKKSPLYHYLHINKILQTLHFSPIKIATGSHRFQR